MLLSRTARRESQSSARYCSDVAVSCLRLRQQYRVVTPDRRIMSRLSHFYTIIMKALFVYTSAALPALRRTQSRSLLCAVNEFTQSTQHTNQRR